MFSLGFLYLRVILKFIYLLLPMGWPNYNMEEQFKIIVQGLKINQVFSSLHYWLFILLLHWSSSNPFKEQIARLYLIPSAVLKQWLESFFLFTLSPAPQDLNDSEAKSVIEIICFCYSWTLNTLKQCFEAKGPLLCLRSTVIHLRTSFWLNSGW